MASDFATKLRITAAALGCAGRKDLCARFRAVNPATHFDLERSHKWLQGRALPRSVQLYEDWAKVLGTKRSGAWLASCTVAAFLDEICVLYDADAGMLLARAEQDAAEASAAHATGHYLCGAYACYSLAWSPYFRGHVIRGALLIACSAAPQRGLSATYSEALLGGTLQLRGGAVVAGRTLHVHLPGAEHCSPLMMTLFLPGPPASVLCGVLSGATVVGSEPLPSMTRLIAVRVPRDASPSNGYIAPSPGALADDLQRLGLRLAEPDTTDAMLRDVLLGGAGGGLDQIPATDQARLAAVFDRAYLVAE